MRCPKNSSQKNSGSRPLFDTQYVGALLARDLVNRMFGAPIGGAVADQMVAA
jgi:hypothetical protein